MSTQLQVSPAERSPGEPSDIYMPPGFTYGERTDTVRGEYGPEVIYDAASLDVDDFVFGKPFNRWRVSVPRPGPYMQQRLSARSVLKYMEATQDIASHRLAAAAIERIQNMLESAEPAGRVLVIEASFKRWLQTDQMLRFIAAIRALYDIDHKRDTLRSDDDVHGTDVWASYGQRPFLLVERSRIAQAPEGQQVVYRRLEAVKFADRQEVYGVLDQLSPTEEMRVKLLLDQSSEAGQSVTPEERSFVYQYATRRTVQQDSDVSRLLHWYRHPPGPSPYTRAVGGLGRLAGKVVRRPVSAPADA